MDLLPYIQRFQQRFAEVESQLSAPDAFASPQKGQELTREHARLRQLVADGEAGELLLRPNEPSLMSDGYHGIPEATAASRRNLWFYTGDLLRRDAEGWYYFVGRRAENIRRRGENISSFEVEEVVKLHPAVADAAAYGVPSELTEDDVMVAVVLREGVTLRPSELTDFCAPRMARHMVDRKSTRLNSSH